MQWSGAVGRTLVGSQARTERHSGAERVCVGRDEMPTFEFCIRGKCFAGSILVPFHAASALQIMPWLVDSRCSRV